MNCLLPFHKHLCLIGKNHKDEAMNTITLNESIIGYTGIFLPYL